MPDSRFFEALGPADLTELAAIAGAEAPGGAAGRRIATVAPLDRAGPDAVSFFNDRRYADALRGTRAGACFVRPEHAAFAPPGCVALITGEPQAAFARAANHLFRERRHPADAPALHPEAELEPGVVLAPGVFVGPGAKIGRGTRIESNVVIGPGVAIGRDGHVRPNAVISHALIGDRVRILAGAVIGEAGFGVAASQQGAMDLPQLGRVILQDDVTVGAQTCIDRGAFDDTVIGEHTKIDNLCQIGHNVVIGRNCALAAQTGLSGSVQVGDGAQFGGKAGVGDHLVLGAGMQLAAGALAMRDIPPGETWCGVPARPIRRFMRELAWVSKMVDRREGARNGDG